MFSSKRSDYTSKSKDRNDNGVSDVTISRENYPHWRDTIQVVEVSPEGTTTKTTANNKALEAGELINERFEQAMVLPTSVSEATLRTLYVIVGSRLVFNLASTLLFIPMMRPLGIVLALAWFVPVGLLVAKVIEKPAFLKVCWWFVLALFASVSL